MGECGMNVHLVDLLGEAIFVDLYPYLIAYYFSASPINNLY